MRSNPLPSGYTNKPSTRTAVITTLSMVLLASISMYAAYAEAPLASDTEQIQLSSAGIMGAASLGLLGPRMTNSKMLASTSDSNPGGIINN